MLLPSGGSLVIDRPKPRPRGRQHRSICGFRRQSGRDRHPQQLSRRPRRSFRQPRPWDIGGIIVVDFIDMVLSNRDLVVRRLVECLGRDRTKHQVAEITRWDLSR